MRKWISFLNFSAEPNSMLMRDSLALSQSSLIFSSAACPPLIPIFAAIQHSEHISFLYARFCAFISFFPLPFICIHVENSHDTVLSTSLLLSRKMLNVVIVLYCGVEIFFHTTSPNVEYKAFYYGIFVLVSLSFCMCGC